MRNQVGFKQCSSYPKVKNTGFTLLQLILVIIIIGILGALALPKMLNLGDDAHIASVKATAGALKSGVDEARDVYLVKVGQGSVDNLQVFADNSPIDQQHPYEQPGILDFNKYGWPVQNYRYPDSTIIQLDNVSDCVSLWRTVLRNNIPSVSPENEPQETDYIARYGGSENGVATQLCRYDYRKFPKLFITYNALTGKVYSNAKPNR